MYLICSNKPRPQVHTGRKGGNQHWKRDVHHAATEGMDTACGIFAPEYLVIGGEISAKEALKDPNLCKRCAKVVETMA